VVKYFKSIGKILLAFNSAFIAPILKVENPFSFDQFLLILLCNNIYKIITNLIAHRLLDFLLDHISLEKFIFLKGQKNHEAIGLS
jgi:uncharacterized membrane-anchored protein YitT (DUF2179 family)